MNSYMRERNHFLGLVCRFKAVTSNLSTLTEMVLKVLSSLPVLLAAIIAIKKGSLFPMNCFYTPFNFFTFKYFGDSFFTPDFFHALHSQL